MNWSRHARDLPLAIGVALAIALAPTPVRAEAPALYYILDGSGSMWGRVDGQMKIQVAKDVMGKLIEGTPNELHAAVSVYGHRRKADCTDIEEIVALGPLDRPDAIRAVKKITPRGKTPISESIKRAAERVKEREEQTTIVLVSDGIETCDSDPCAVTRALKESGAKFVLHVVGFAVDDATREQLSCVAEAGGGSYWSTSDADELLSTLSRIQESAVTQVAMATPQPAPEPTASPKRIVQESSGGSTSIKIKAARPGRIRFAHDEWVKRPYYWKLVDAETGEEKFKAHDLSEQIVPPGTYQLVWREREHGAGEVLLGEVMTVAPGEVVEVPLRTAIRLNVPTWVDDPYYWMLRDPDTDEIVARFRSLVPQLVPPGEWDLIWRQVEHGAQETRLGNIKVDPDVTNQVEIATSIQPARADWVHEDTYYWGLQDPESGKWIARFGKKIARQLVGPGQYRLVYRRSEHGSSESDLGLVEISEGQLNEPTINTGVKIVPSPDLAPPYRIEYIELDEDGKEIRMVTQGGRWEPMPLKPGKYRVNYHQKEHQTEKFTLVESFDLPAGALVEIDL
ncbi:MAG: VWA domain-containing protein [Candidatus Binatia bacterium]|nr:VWA domain-containing protein [Candidatus Binatia bacterium]